MLRPKCHPCKKIPETTVQKMRHNGYYVTAVFIGGIMTDKELRRLSRAELLKMLLAQTEENQKLKKQLQEAKDALAERQIAIDNAGTLAEAALALNGVFAAADEAARQYLENVRRLAGRDGDES